VRASWVSETWRTFPTELESHPVAKSETPARDAVLVKYLNEAYGKEQQLETALKAQIALAQRPQLKKGLQEHLKVTKAQSRGLKKRIKELGGEATAGMDLPGPHLVSDVATAGASVVNKAMATAKGPVQALRGTSPADNQLRQIRDCLWNEAEEIAHYHVIEATAEALDDKETAKLARTYRGEEEKMQRLLERQIAPLEGGHQGGGAGGRAQAGDGAAQIRRPLHHDPRERRPVRFRSPRRHQERVLPHHRRPPRRRVVQIRTAP
jgi:ferritin-like metal-binding protein YciE